MTPEVFACVAVMGVCFILGTWYGLYLNVTHWHRMGLWAEKVVRMQERLKEAEARGANR